MEEKWKIIDGFSRYLVSNTGRVKNVLRLRDLKFYDRNGYKRIDLINDENIKKKVTVHRLVAQAFIPNLNNKPQVNRKDGNRANNNVKNLEWCTPKENTAHAIKTGLTDFSKINYRRGEGASRSKMTDDSVKELRMMYDTGEFTLKELSIYFDISITAVWRIVNRETWTHIE